MAGTDDRSHVTDSHGAAVQVATPDSLRPNIPRDASGLPVGRTKLHSPGSVTRRIGGDVRNLLMAGSTFVLQVAHPLVGAGVGEHSKYREDPWGRLRDIDASGRRFAWQDEASCREEGARLRRIHRGIAGVMPSGERYHSLDPHGYGWVHTVLLDSMLRQTELFGDPLTAEDEQRLFVEWYEAALFLGLRDAHLPRSLGEHRERFDHALRTEAAYTSVVEDLLTRPIAPPVPPETSVWAAASLRAAWKPLGLGSRWMALACLPPVFRERIAHAHPWTDADEAALRRLRSTVRSVVPRLPLRTRTFPDAQRIAREEAASA